MAIESIYSTMKYPTVKIVFYLLILTLFASFLFRKWIEIVTEKLHKKNLLIVATTTTAFDVRYHFLIRFFERTYPTVNPAVEQQSVILYKIHIE